MPLRCVDASLVVAWLVPSQRSASVESAWLAYAKGEDDFVAPPLLPAETISAIRRLTSRGILSQEEADGLVTDFLALAIPTPAPAGLYKRAYALAAKYHRSTVYDTCYLALAEFLSCDFLTLDRRLYDRVKADFPEIRLV